MKGRILHFLRHGQYEHVEGVEGGRLTAVGRRQARHTARWLARLPAPTVCCSDLGRAIETATILTRGREVALRRTSLLREMAPTAIPGMRVPLHKRALARQNLQRIRERWFRPTRGTRHEVIVCHGNLIRSLLCTVLDVRLTAWLRMHVHHCGITRFAVKPDGRIALLAFNETGHLPTELVTES